MVDDVVRFVHINFSLKGRRVVGYVAMVMDFASLASLKELIAQFIQYLLSGFVGLNLMQASITGFCPAAMVFKAFGLKRGAAFE